jgi:hypothetical protein
MDHTDSNIIIRPNHNDERADYRRDHQRAGVNFDWHANWLWRHAPGTFKVTDCFDITFRLPPYRGHYAAIPFRHVGQYIVICSWLYWHDHCVTTLECLHSGKRFYAHVRSWCLLNEYFEPTVEEDTRIQAPRIA